MNEGSRSTNITFNDMSLTIGFSASRVPKNVTPVMSVRTLTVPSLDPSRRATCIRLARFVISMSSFLRMCSYPTPSIQIIGTGALYRQRLL